MSDKSEKDVPHAPDIPHIDIKEFIEKGYLQEVNRRFLHPLGLALCVSMENETEAYSLEGIWDYRNDPEGMTFGLDDPEFSSEERLERFRKNEKYVEDQFLKFAKVRCKMFHGKNIEAVPK